MKLKREKKSRKLKAILWRGSQIFVSYFPPHHPATVLTAQPRTTPNSKGKQRKPRPKPTLQTGEAGSLLLLGATPAGSGGQPWVELWQQLEVGRQLARPPTHQAQPRQLLFSFTQSQAAIKRAVCCSLLISCCWLNTLQS